jgi:thiol-disulfide isomerase/thioredoxin
MRTRPVIAVALAAALLVLTGCAVTPGAASEPAGDAGAEPGVTGTAAGKTGEPADGRADRPVPKLLSFTAETLDGRRFEASALAGRPAVLWFWAPWCATCAGQAATITEVSEKYGDRLGVVGVAGLGDKAAMDEFVSDLDVGGVTHLNDQPGAVWRRFEVTEQSTFVLIDRDGRLVHRGWLDSVDFVDRVAGLTA